MTAGPEPGDTGPGPTWADLVDALPHGAVVVDGDDVVVAANGGAVVLAAGSDVPAVGAALGSPGWLGPRGEDGAWTEPRRTRPDGPWVRHRSAVVGGRVAGHRLILIEDVTDEVRDRNALVGSATVRRSLATQLDDTNARLLSANAELQRFASSVAHDLRAPLATVTGFAEVLPDLVDMDDRAGDAVDRIRRNATRAMTMVDSLLSYARAASSPGSTQAVDLAAVVEWCVDAVADRLRAVGAIVEWSDLPSVAGNEAALRQVFGNLIDNAVRHGGAGSPVRIAIDAIPSTTQDQVEVHVCDDGVGIPDDRRDGVFAMGATFGSDDDDRTGIGLAASRAVVQAMGGDIWVLDQPAETGTCVGLRLPGAAVADAELVAGTVTLFAVDDDPDAAHMVRLLARVLGVAMVAEADSVASAKETYAAMDPPDVVTLDLELPDGEGLDLARWILAREPDQTILVFSSHADPSVHAAAAAAGVSLVVDKASSDDFLTALRLVVERLGPGA